MNSINKLSKLDWTTIILGVIHLLLAFVAATKFVAESLLFYMPWVLAILCSLLLFLRLKDNDWLIKNPVRFYLIGLLFAVQIILPLGVRNGLNYSEDVLVEAHGLLFDLIVFGVLLAIYEQMRLRELNRRELIDKYLDDIEDYREWQTDEASFRLRGLINRLNRLDHYKIKLSSARLTNLDMLNYKFDGSYLFETKFNKSNLSDATFIASANDNV